ncbi:MAG: hypothetical protein JWM47_1725 [Acidimicrobiales bacterium]|nr:hypothetical protein [Acidimicrobiales bacterium]
MKIRTIAVIAFAACLPFAAVACGGSDDTNSGTRPTSGELSKAISKELNGTALPAGVVDCIAKKVHGSDIPNGVLRAIVEGREASVDKDNEGKYTTIITEAASSCATSAGQ